MLIWIRSQDRKTLAVVNSVDIHYNKINQTNYDIWSINSARITGFVLGTYATEERAMEVLDDIQIAIEKRLKVFQMPKE